MSLVLSQRYALHVSSCSGDSSSTARTGLNRRAGAKTMTFTPLRTPNVWWRFLAGAHWRIPLVGPSPPRAAR